MNEAVVQDEALGILDDMAIRYKPWKGTLHTVDTVEMASGLCYQAMQASVSVMNVTTAEDLAIRNGKVCGVVVNASAASGVLHVDPITLGAKLVIDGTGHDASMVACLRKRGLLDTDLAANVEGPMNAEEGERFVVEKVGEPYPGLWLAGMSVCAIYGGPRMGPIFGGMLLSGKRAAEEIAERLAKS